MLNVIFVQPFTVNADLAVQCGRRVAVLDVAFNAGSPAGKGALQEQFENTTLAFINALGDRLALWLDHHPHQAWTNVSGDARFVLVPREQAPACPPLITTDLVSAIGEVDTIIAHGDFDGVMSAAKFALRGYQPYAGADADSIAADSRIGTLSLEGQRYEEAMKANLSDDSIRQAIFDELVYESADAGVIIDEAQSRYAAIKAETQRLTEHYQIVGNVAYVDATEAALHDRTQLLLAGQRKASVAIVRTIQPHNGTTQLIVAAPKEWNFVEMFGLSGGMPNRVTLPDHDIDTIIATINAQ